ncbi:hypothetical protein GETHPA_17350 [Geothrix rubra]|uniref:Uncharacterized protein n=1 Tax=Geothrix rubra TaxID=2927977 RepID=A0ABQ5Q6I3_9BACT|nr:hypothetical protein [Geothrix rubra]GLH70202.1 hypothetical protein GETHPA_17350 [Geothrix rubra]
MNPRLARFLVALLVLGTFAWVLASAVAPRLRQQLAPEPPSNLKPVSAPGPASTGVTGEVSDATRESLQKHLEQRRKKQEAGAKP